MTVTFHTGRRQGRREEERERVKWSSKEESREWTCIEFSGQFAEGQSMRNFFSVKERMSKDEREEKEGCGKRRKKIKKRRERKTLKVTFHVSHHRKRRKGTEGFRKCCSLHEFFALTVSFLFFFLLFLDDFQSGDHFTSLSRKFFFSYSFFHSSFILSDPFQFLASFKTKSTL